MDGKVHDSRLKRFKSFFGVVMSHDPFSKTTQVSKFVHSCYIYCHLDSFGDSHVDTSSVFTSMDWDWDQHSHCSKRVGHQSEGSPVAAAHHQCLCL